MPRRRKSPARPRGGGAIGTWSMTPTQEERCLLVVGAGFRRYGGKVHLQLAMEK
jgi:hypothetical protein